MTQGSQLAVVMKSALLTHRSIFFLWMFWKWFIHMHATKTSVSEQLFKDPTIYVVDRYFWFSSKSSFIFLHHSCCKAHLTVKQHWCCTCGMQFIPTNSHKVFKKPLKHQHQHREKKLAGEQNELLPKIKHKSLCMHTYKRFGSTCTNFTLSSRRKTYIWFDFKFTWWDIDLLALFSTLLLGSLTISSFISSNGKTEP